MLGTLRQVADSGLWAIEAAFPSVINSPEEVKPHLKLLPEDGVVENGNRLMVEWGSAELDDPFREPNAIEDPRYVQLNRSLTAGYQAIRSSRIIDVSRFSTRSGVESHGFVVRVPLGFGLFPLHRSDLPTETRYYKGIEATTPELEAASRAVYEVSAGIEGDSQLAQLASDIKTHKRWVEESSFLFGYEAKRIDEEAIREVVQSFNKYFKETGRNPADYNNMQHFLIWFAEDLQKQKLD